MQSTGTTTWHGSRWTGGPVYFCDSPTSANNACEDCERSLFQEREELFMMRWLEVTWWGDLIHPTAKRPGQLCSGVSWHVYLANSKTPSNGKVSATQGNLFWCLNVLTTTSQKWLLTPFCNPTHTFLVVFTMVIWNKLFSFFFFNFIFPKPLKFLKTVFVSPLFDCLL